jgi:hypothetical protein
MSMMAWHFFSVGGILLSSFRATLINVAPVKRLKGAGRTGLLDVYWEPVPGARHSEAKELSPVVVAGAALNHFVGAAALPRWPPCRHFEPLFTVFGVTVTQYFMGQNHVCLLTPLH